MIDESANVWREQTVKLVLPPTSKEQHVMSHMAATNSKLENCHRSSAVFDKDGSLDCIQAYIGYYKISRSGIKLNSVFYGWSGTSRKKENGDKVQPPLWFFDIKIGTNARSETTIAGFWFHKLYHATVLVGYRVWL